MTTLTAQGQQREQLLAEMMPKCQKVAEEFAKKLTQVAKGVVLIKYDIGARLQEVSTKEEEYGSDAIKQLAAYLNFPGGSTALYALRQLAEEFDRDFISQQVVMPMLDGSSLEVGHFVLISRVKTKADQKKLFVRVRQECLSTRELEQEIQAQFERRNTRSGGRNPKAPTSPEAGLQNLFSVAQRLDNFFDTLDPHVFDKLNTFTVEDIKPQLTEKLLQAKTQLEMLLTDGKEVLSKMDKVSARLHKLTASRGKAESAPESESGRPLVLKKPPKGVAPAAVASGKKKPVKAAKAKGRVAKKATKKKKTAVRA